MPQKSSPKKPLRPAQAQKKQPGREWKMKPRPQVQLPEYRAAGKLQDKVALITGGDSGIGRAVAVLFAKEGAQVAITYLDEERDAKETERLVAAEGGKCVALRGDIGEEMICFEMVEKTVRQFGRLDILVNNAAEQHMQEDVRKITAAQLERTFRTNLFSYFYFVKAALKHLKAGGTIINTTSVTAYRGSAHLMDYAATKGAIVAFTRSLAQALVEKGIRVNGVAPGPVWTPLIPASFSEKQVATFGSDVPMKRAGEPSEIAPCFVFLASADSSYMTGQVLHPNGGEIVNG
ncbi:MAG: SDR family oxidoreductase [Verrucomicrobiota bacterium]|jgi:NAD(P)-dependent dehydrogenase (short-subunit alcohol dehydrogenase family)